MKKNSKKGFSLAEVLISVGIVSVIATLGFSVARTNLDRAYNMYVYTGAKYLSDAITDAELRNQAGNIDALKQRLETLFNSQFELDQPELEEGHQALPIILHRMVAPNGIVYRISEFENYTDPSNPKPVYYINMQVPTRRGVEISGEIYDPTTNTIIQNQEPPQQDPNGPNPIQIDYPSGYHFYHLSGREDLPTLIPQGSLATQTNLIKYYIKPPGQPDTPRTRRYYSFRDAACSKIRGDKAAAQGQQWANAYIEESYIDKNKNSHRILDCSEAIQEPEVGILTMARP